MTDLRVRIVRGSLDEWPKRFLQTQVRNSGIEMLRLTDAACDMLTSLAGIRGSRRRRRLWDDLGEIVNGELPGGDEEYTDDSTGTFGQMLGPLFAILGADSGGAWEIIRVLEEPAGETRPDFILVNRGNGSITVHECKGVATDCNKVRMRGKFDLCDSILRQYREGREKLRGDLHPDLWELRRLLTLIGDGQVLPFPTNKLLVSVVAISDGRLGALNPSPRHVPGCGIPCTQHCVADGTNGIVIAALAEKILIDAKSDSSLSTPPSGSPQFPILDAYKACERALWQDSGSALGSAYAGLLNATRYAEYDDDAIIHSIDFLISPLETAAAQGVAIDMRQALVAADKTLLPKTFVDALHYWEHRQPLEQLERPEEIDVSQLGQILGQYGQDTSNYTGRGEWVVHDSSERHVHLRLIPTPAGRLARLSPREVLSSPDDGAHSMLDLSAQLLSASFEKNMPFPIIRELFTRQEITLKSGENSPKEIPSFNLGWSIFPGDDNRIWREFLNQNLGRGILPGPWHKCPRGHPFMHEFWLEILHECRHCGRCAVDTCWLPGFPFRAWVSYDGRAEFLLP